MSNLLNSLFENVEKKDGKQIHNIELSAVNNVAGFKLDKSQFPGLSDENEYILISAKNDDRYEKVKTVLSLITRSDLELAIDQGFTLDTLYKYPAVFTAEIPDYLVAEDFSEGELFCLKEYDWYVAFKQRKVGNNFPIVGIKVVIDYESTING